MLSSFLLRRKRSVTSTEDECPYGRAVGVEDLGLAQLQRLPECHLTEVAVQGVGELPYVK